MKRKAKHSNKFITEKSWVTEECKNLGKQKKLLLRQYTKNSNPTNHALYKTARNQHNKVLRGCSDNFEKQNFSKRDRAKILLLKLII